MDGQTEEKEEVPVKGKGKGPLKGKKSVKGKSPSKGKGAASAKKKVDSQSSTEESVVELMEDEKVSPKTEQISEDCKSDLSEIGTAKGSKRKSVKESMVTGKKVKTEQTLEKSGTSKEPSAQERLQQRLNQRKKEARQSKRGRKPRPIT